MKKSLTRRRPAVQLSEAQSRELFARFRCYANECCDKCGRVLGLVRFTFATEPEKAWCSRACRDDFGLFNQKGVCKNCGGPLAATATEDTKYCCKECGI